jgi:hypothetical protein
VENLLFQGAEVAAETAMKWVLIAGRGGIDRFFPENGEQNGGFLPLDRNVHKKVENKR